MLRSNKTDFDSKSDCSKAYKETTVNYQTNLESNLHPSTTSDFEGIADLNENSYSSHVMNFSDYCNAAKPSASNYVTQHTSSNNENSVTDNDDKTLNDYTRNIYENGIYSIDEKKDESVWNGDSEKKESLLVHDYSYNFKKNDEKKDYKNNIYSKISYHNFNSSIMKSQNNALHAGHSSYYKASIETQKSHNSTNSNVLSSSGSNINYTGSKSFNTFKSFNNGNDDFAVNKDIEEECDNLEASYNKSNNGYYKKDLLHSKSADGEEEMADEGNTINLGKWEEGSVLEEGKHNGDCNNVRRGSRSGHYESNNHHLDEISTEAELEDQKREYASSADDSYTDCNFNVLLPKRKSSFNSKRNELHTDNTNYNENNNRFSLIYGEKSYNSDLSSQNNNHLNNYNRTGLSHDKDDDYSSNKQHKSDHHHHNSKCSSDYSNYAVAAAAQYMQQQQQIMISSSNYLPFIMSPAYQLMVQQSYAREAKKDELSEGSLNDTPLNLQTIRHQASNDHHYDTDCIGSFHNNSDTNGYNFNMEQLQQYYNFYQYNNRSNKQHTPATHPPPPPPPKLDVPPPPPPKRPLTPYMRFSKCMWQEVKLNNPGMSVCEIGATIGSMWRELSSEQKQRHNDDFTLDKVRYDTELKQYLKETGLKSRDLVKMRSKNKPSSKGNSRKAISTNQTFPYTPPHHTSTYNLPRGYDTTNPQLSLMHMSMFSGMFPHMWTQQYTPQQQQMLASLQLAQQQGFYFGNTNNDSNNNNSNNYHQQSSQAFQQVSNNSSNHDASNSNNSITGKSNPHSTPSMYL